MSDVLQTCPAELRPRYEGMAKRAQRERGVAIRLKCLECCAWQQAEVARCQITSCALWRFNKAAQSAQKREETGDE